MIQFINASKKYDHGVTALDMANLHLEQFLITLKT